MFSTPLAWPQSRRRKEFESIYASVKVPTEIRHKTGPVTAGMKGSDWQTMDMYCFVAFALEMDGPESVKYILLVYTFLVRVMYLPDSVVIGELVTRMQLSSLKDSFLRRYEQVFGETTMTFNLHSFFHCIEYRLKHGPVWQYSTAMYESLYAKTRRCYTGHAPNVPKQLLSTYHAYSQSRHRCHLQATMKVAPVASAKTDDTYVFKTGKFYKVLKKREDSVTIQEVKTTSLSTSQLVKLPWSTVGVRLLEGTLMHRPVTVSDSEIEGKGVVCNNVISSMYPQWVIT